ncbi:MAG TPA: serine hydrolase [Candidatus Dormibacteraeota bacterium]|nr:serine hydrolase [Candidatus Dormibacteraeota bacterium]
MAKHSWCAFFLAAAMAITSPCGVARQAGTPASEIKRLDASTISAADVDATVSRLMAAGKVTGAGVAIFNDKKVVYSKAFGLRDQEKNLPLTPDSVMIAASLSKSIFAYMVMQLVQEHVVDLDKPVYQYLPKRLAEYPRYADLADDPRYKKVTLRMLLSHTSGFPNWRAFTDGKLSIHFAPGSRFAYSGEGIQLAQTVVEIVTKKPLTQLMQERVFQPLGMTRTSMVWDARFEDNFANGYDEAGRSLGPQRRSHADAAGSMLTTLHDYGLFLQAVAQGQDLDQKTRALMFTPQISILSRHEFPTLDSETTDENKAIQLSYGLGWGLYTTPEGPAFFKEGHDDGWRHYCVYFDKAGVGMLIMTNSSNGEGIYQELLETVIKNTYTPVEWESFTRYTETAPVAPPVEHHEIAVDSAQLAPLTGHYRTGASELFTITLKDGHLFIQENDSPGLELFAEGPREFFAKMLDLTLSFEGDVGGHPTTLNLRVKGQPGTATRIE